MLNATEKGLLPYALWVAKARDKTSNTRLMMQFREIALKLLENFTSLIGKAGRERPVIWCWRRMRSLAGFSVGLLELGNGYIIQEMCGISELCK
jgi:hypothetical protein